MPIIISSSEQTIFLPAEIGNVPCHDEVNVRPVISSRNLGEKTWVVSDVVCLNNLNCNFPQCRFKNPCEI